MDVNTLIITLASSLLGSGALVAVIQILGNRKKTNADISDIQFQQLQKLEERTDSKNLKLESQVAKLSKQVIKQNQYILILNKHITLLESIIVRANPDLEIPPVPELDFSIFDTGDEG